SCIQLAPLSHAGAPLPLYSFPTRRSSDLRLLLAVGAPVRPEKQHKRLPTKPGERQRLGPQPMAHVEGRGPSRCRSPGFVGRRLRSEEHTSELQSRFDLVCRLLLEKKKRVT